MTDYIKDDTALGNAKTNFILRPDVPDDEKIRALDYNAFRQALLDIKSWLRGGLVGAAARPQRFVVTRQGGDTDTITVNGARGFVARPNATYHVQVTLGANSLGVGVVGCDPADFTTTQFKLRLTAAWGAGDTAFVTVEELT